MLVSATRFEHQLNSRYFEWLTAKVGTGGRRRVSYSRLFHILHNVAFSWFVPNDDNRGADGLRLRTIFIDELFPFEDDDIVISGPCSILEVLVALAIRCENDIMLDLERGDRTSTWFWLMLNNLDLTRYTDSAFTDEAALEIEDKLSIFVNREYEFNGSGGLFPLKHPETDQRAVEIWYQMNAYLIENF